MKKDGLSEKKKKNTNKLTVVIVLLTVLSVVVFALTRAFCLYSNWGRAVDVLGYHNLARMGKEQAFYSLSSGIAYTYTEHLSRMLEFVKQSRWGFALFQCLQQTVSYFLLMVGCYLLFGKVTACIAGFSVALSPWMLQSILEISPENHYFLFFSFTLFLIGIFYRIGKKKGFYRNNFGEGFMMFLGFWLGVMLIYHFFSICLILFLVWIIARNAPIVAERKAQQKNKLEMERLTEEEIKDKDLRYAVMPVSSQILILFSGIFIGAFATLMKYTGFTGYYIGQQFKWWLAHFSIPEEGIWQDIALWLIDYLAVLMLAGFIIYFAKEREAYIRQHQGKEKGTAKRKEKTGKKEKDAVKTTEQTVTQDKFTAENSEKINLESEKVQLAESICEDTDDWRFDDEADIDNWRFDDEPAVEERILQSTIKEDAEKKMPERKTEEVKVEDVTVRKSDEKKVTYLENPLPVPKRHEKKVMDFETEIKEKELEKDDFDFAFDDADDFDV